MKNSFSRTVALVTMVAFFIQLFCPLIVVAQQANHKEQIQKAVDEFQTTYDEIMAIEEVELGPVTEEIVRMIWNCENYIAIPRDDKGITTPDQAAEWAAKMQAQQEKAKLEGYLAQIKQANEDIRKIKADAKKTMSSLKDGSLEDAASTDPTKVYNSLDNNASALAIYQKALTKAGQKLVSIGDMLSTISATITTVTGILSGIALFVPLAPFVVSVVAVLGPIAGACSISAGIISGSGESLIEAAEKAITSDEQLAAVVGNNCSKAWTEEFISWAAGKGFGKLANIYATTAIGDPSDLLGDPELHKFISTQANKFLGALFKPATSGLTSEIQNNLDTINKDAIEGNEPAEKEKDLIPAFLSPNLHWQD